MATNTREPLPTPRVEITSDTYTVRWLTAEGAQIALITFVAQVHNPRLPLPGDASVWTVAFSSGRGHGAEVYDVGVRELRTHVGPKLLVGCDSGVSLRAARRWDRMVTEGSASWTLEPARTRSVARLAFGPGAPGPGADWWRAEKARRIVEGTLVESPNRAFYQTPWAKTLYHVVLR